MNGNRNRYTSAPLYGIKNKNKQQASFQQPAKEQRSAAPTVQTPEAAPTQYQPYPPAQPGLIFDTTTGQYVQQPYAAPQQGYPYPQPAQAPGQPYPNASGYPPQNYQTPVQQPPYAQQPYGQTPQTGYGMPQQNPYAQNNPYGQPYATTGANPYATQQGAPMTAPGGATSQQPTQAAPASAPLHRKISWLVPVIALVLPILFVLTLIFPVLPLQVFFIAATAGILIYMWVSHSFGKNARYTLSLVYAALMIVVAVSLIVSLPAPEGSGGASAGIPDPATVFSGNSALDSSVYLGSSSNTESDDASTELLSASSNQVTVAQTRLETFMSYWSEDQLDQMLELCAPAWVSSKAEPKTELFNTLANRIPTAWKVESVSGSDADDSRTITLTVLIDKRNATAPAYYQLQVLMLSVNDTWYVNPDSLSGLKLDTTPSIDAAETASSMLVTNAPTTIPTDPPSATMLLYYNPNGGQYYHSKSDCSSVNSKFLPLTSFYYSELNSDKYKNLRPCTECKPVARPSVTGE